MYIEAHNLTEKLEDSEPQMTFTIFANSTSKEKIPRKPFVLKTNVVKQAELDIKG
jgi:Integrin alpha